MKTLQAACFANFDTKHDDMWIFSESAFAQSDSSPDGTLVQQVTKNRCPCRFDTYYESELLIGTHQLITDSLRSGEGYFSADGSQLIFQSEVPGNNPFYQIFVRDLQSGDTSLVSPG